MSGEPTSILARKIAAHQRRVPKPPDISADLARVFERSIRHAAAPFGGLGLEVRDPNVQTDCGLDDAVGRLPDGMVIVLEDSGGARGILALSHGLSDALIEVQTTGHVEPLAFPPRPVTQIDEALSRDFVDLCLTAFSKECQALAVRRWPMQLRFGSRVEDRTQLPLLLADGRFHIAHANLAFRGTERMAEIALVLPDCAAGLPEVAGVTPEALEAWRSGLATALMDAPIAVDAVLVRHHMCLGDVQRLHLGQRIGFALADLQSVSVEDGSGRRLHSGALGQIGGKRAIRFSGAGSDEQVQDAKDKTLDPGAPAEPAPAAVPSAITAPTPIECPPDQQLSKPNAAPVPLGT